MVIMAHRVLGLFYDNGLEVKFTIRKSNLVSERCYLVHSSTIASLTIQKGLIIISRSSNIDLITCFVVVLLERSSAILAGRLIYGNNILLL